MTDDDASTIGTELALGNGLSDVIATLEPELKALGNTITASAVMLQELTQLGQGLNAFNANAAPIAVPSRDAHSSEAPAEPVRPAASNRARVVDAQGPGMHEAGSPLAPAA